ncbi:MAG TPA: prephenate dehydrogenase/arogenate dehydrogenase family protein [Acidiferrobacterales bacterium]|nr:prephenate dehydrogenase/arogenate dehydrogenase family protein [Acidiferrobacterales bacterium]
MIKKLVIIGVGLIGGSLARALKQAGEVREVIGVGRHRDHLQQAIDLGVIDKMEMSLPQATRDADMIVVATPVGELAAIFKQIAPALSANAILTDVGSVKGSVVTAAQTALGQNFSAYVPGHPLAGAEKSGVLASVADLFRGRRVILTPVNETRAMAVEQVRAMWQAVGAEVKLMSAAEHDAILAATSHLPHVLAYALMDMLVRLRADGSLFGFTAGGFRDFSRIASSDPVIWRDICLANRTALMTALSHYKNNLDTLMRAIEMGDGETLLATFMRAKQARDTSVGLDRDDGEID